MLKGRIFGAKGHAMLHIPVRGRSGQIFRYYVTTSANRHGAGTSPGGRFRAQEIEDAVFDLVERIMAVTAARTPSHTPGETAARVEAEVFGAVRRPVQRVDVGPDGLRVTLTGGGVVPLSLVGTIAETRRTKRSV